MRRSFSAIALSLLAALPLAAQQRHLPVEVGVFGQYTKFADVTKLDNVIGLGALVGIPVWQRIALQYEGDFASTRSSRVGDLTALNHRFDLVYHLPIKNGHTFFFGGGWTGSQYKSDTTKNQYDSGGNATLGFRWCVNRDWNIRTSGVMDFKDPSDQVPTGDRTQTLGLRLGVSRFFGAKGGQTPCVTAAPAPAPVPPPVVIPVPTPAPAPAPPPAPAPRVEPALAPAPPPASRRPEAARDLPHDRRLLCLRQERPDQAGKDTLRPRSIPERQSWLDRRSRGTPTASAPTSTTAHCRIVGRPRS